MCDARFSRLTTTIWKITLYTHKEDALRDFRLPIIWYDIIQAVANANTFMQHVCDFKHINYYIKIIFETKNTLVNYFTTGINEIIRADALT